MENKKPRSGYSATVPVLGVLVCLYFVCPYLYLSPPILIYGKHGNPPAVGLTFFWPIKALAEHVPLYRRFLEEEGRLLGLD